MNQVPDFLPQSDPMNRYQTGYTLFHVIAIYAVILCGGLAQRLTKASGIGSALAFASGCMVAIALYYGIGAMLDRFGRRKEGRK